ncbi:MAG TPA: MBL fold metallo-hydrolase [Vicinamibacterales bacterium]|nr:MBL fold metallo-hydrolase [Vicinamibacterales bacterium]
MPRFVFVIFVFSAAYLLVFSVAGGAQGNQTRTPSSSAVQIETLPVQGNVSVITGLGGNVVVQVGPLGPVVVDTGLSQNSDALLAAIRKLSNRPIRYIINTHMHADHTGGNEKLAAAGQPPSGRGVTQVGASTIARAEIIAHDLVLQRMSTPGGSETPAPIGLQPTATYSLPVKEFFTNGEGIQIVHAPNAHTDGDSLVFFRRSDVIAAGDVYSTVSYPVIDTAHGGSITGVIAGLNELLALAIPGEKTEGGTMIVPGHGRISDEADLVEYRDMVTIIRDRVQDMVKRKMTLDQIKARNPSMEYDGEYASAPGWTKDQFVEAVYRGLSPAK